MFYATVADDYTVVIRDIDGKHALYSPFELEILPGDIVYQSTLIPCGSFCANCLDKHSGREEDRGYSDCGKNGLASPTAGILFTFYVQSRDFFGNNLTSGNITWDIQVVSDVVNPPSRIDHAEFGFNTGSPARFGNAGTIFTLSLIHI